MSNYEDYALVYRVDFQLEMSGPTQNPPDGYLFACPTEGFRSGPTSFRWSDCPSYWWLDPSGAESLSPDEATVLGFPSTRPTTQVYTQCWDASGLRRFHQAKGFDPDSQDVARNLGHPLYQISSEPQVASAHSEAKSAPNWF
ncbi:hypothetical protein DFH07DRAFT_927516 [Mycena maculata]|uniref:Uncharacterized protein n=1 Tax=Mycena maculata TaxID=230809 RepID=A0AAD7IAP2_9AGAR|nr:hypothetical protein DFH07DRAFT_927516 [Mycena maculata]